MWEELRSAIFDRSAVSGFRIGFLENLSAEFIGVIFGVVVSFAVAFTLDKIGNSRQFKPLRHRLASQLAHIHAEVFQELARPFNRAGNNGQGIARSLQKLDHTVEQFDFGLTPKQLSQVDAYRARLQQLQRIASQSLHRNETLRREYKFASRALRPALKLLHSGQLEPYWKEVLAADFGGPEDSPTENAATPAWLASRDLSRN